ncbi:MAG: tryptophan 7-halogenase [Proteobacteria bacterium]|nr:tryptophan 7-halogenase [Pseudomonadota bacterium]
MPEPIQQIVIVGGDACAPAVAACIANSLRGTDAKITLLDDMSDHSGVASTLPRSTNFYKLLRFDERSLVTETGATFKLGTEHSGWLRDDRRFIQSFGEHGTPIRLLPFHQYVLNHRLADDAVDFADFSLASAAILEGRFAYPSNDPRSLLSTIHYGLQVDTQRFALAMLKYAVAAGVKHIASITNGATVDADSGFIAAVTLEDGTVINGDFFIDCTGERALLISGALGVGYQSWSEFLPCDRCVRISTNDVQDLSPTTRVVAKRNGWSRRMQLIDRADFEFFYNGAICGDEDAAKQLTRDVGASASLPVHRQVRAGRRESFWRGNCMAIGRSAGDLESLEISAMSRAHSAVVRLMSLWPHSDCDPVIAGEYNRLTSLEYEHALDFVALFYALSDRDDSDFWRHCQALKTSATLDYRLSLFRSRGRLSWDAEENFSRDNWVSALLGLNCLPRACDPLVDIADPKLVSQFMDEIRQAVREAVNEMPRHDTFLKELPGTARQ